jgi:large subunit ribosomal protein L30
MEREGQASPTDQTVRLDRSSLPGARAVKANQRTDAKGGSIRVTLVRSPIGFDRKQLAVIKGLGLRRIRHTVELKDTADTRGMIHKVRHLVEVTE